MTLPLTAAGGGLGADLGGGGGGARLDGGGGGAFLGGGGFGLLPDGGGGGGRPAGGRTIVVVLAMFIRMESEFVLLNNLVPDNFCFYSQKVLVIESSRTM